MNRYKSNANLLMAIVFFVCFFILWNVTDLILRLEYQREGDETYPYTLSMNVQFEKFVSILEQGHEEEAQKYLRKQMKDMYDKIQEIKTCDIIYSDMAIFLKNQSDITPFEIILQDNDQSAYEKQKNINKNGILVIGESLEKSMEKKKAGQVVQIGENNYAVKAVLKNHGINKQDERAFFHFQKLEDKSEKKFWQLIENDCMERCNANGIIISFGGKEHSEVLQCYERFEKYFETMGDVNVEKVFLRKNSGRKGYLNHWYELYHKIFGISSLLFAVLSCIVVSNLWFQEYRKEYVVRLAFGYSAKQIFVTIWKNYLYIAGTVLVGSTLFWCLFLGFRGKKVLWQFLLPGMGFLFLGIILIILVTMYLPYRKIISIDPAEMLNKYRR